MTDNFDVKDALYAIQTIAPMNKHVNKTIRCETFLLTKLGFPPAFAFMEIHRFLTKTTIQNFSFVKLKNISTKVRANEITIATINTKNQNS